MEGLKTKSKQGNKKREGSFMFHSQKGHFIKIHISNSTLLASSLDLEHKPVKYFYLCEFCIQTAYWDRYLFHEAPKRNA